MTDNSQSTALVVDSDQQICARMTELLVTEGFAVNVADDSDTAQSLLSEERVDIVFIALDQDGDLDLLAHLASTNSSVRVVTLIDAGDEERITDALRVGAFDYLEKPLNNLPRIQSVVRKAQENIMLSRDNTVLITRLENSHTKLAHANAQITTLNTQLQTLTVIDSLTDMYNRSYIDSALVQEFERFERYRDPFSILIVDIDNFRSFNDTHGHGCGDTALKHVAEIIKRNGRNTDTVARYGGTQFILLLTRTPAENAVIVGERLRMTIEDTPVNINGQEMTLTISAGLAGASFSEPAGSLAELLNRCVEALQRAKKSGRNQVCAYGDDQDDENFDPSTWSGRAA